ncbi:MAG: M16 family metallopeptidase [Candidatus Kapaibacterium sp.]
MNRRKKYPIARSIAAESSAIRYTKTVIPQGLTIITEEVPTVDSVAIGACVRAGTRHEPAELEGIAHFLEHAVFRRTRRHNTRQIASQFESVGAYTNAYTTKEYTFYYVRTLKPHIRKSLGLLMDVVFSPRFRASEIDRERSIILEEIRSYDDDPEELIFDFADRLLYGAHPLGNPIVGTAESIERIGPPELEAFHRAKYHYNNIIISAAGNISHKRLVDNIIAMLPQISPPETPLQDSAPSDYTQRIEAYERPVQQSHLALVNRTAGIDDVERFPLAVLNVLLGDGMSSRLNQRIREISGYAYSVYSTLQLYSDSGGFYVYAATDPKNISRTKRLIFKEFEKLLAGKISRAELVRSREQLKSSTIMSLESMSMRMQSLAKNELLLGRKEDIPELMARIDAVGVSDIAALAEKYLSPGQWSEVRIIPEL